ncbi:hypothetical protein ACOMCU_27195 [Lysinibacillus sp. UGB7]
MKTGTFNGDKAARSAENKIKAAGLAQITIITIT